MHIYIELGAGVANVMKIFQRSIPDTGEAVVTEGKMEWCNFFSISKTTQRDRSADWRSVTADRVIVCSIEFPNRCLFP